MAHRLSCTCITNLDFFPFFPCLLIIPSIETYDPRFKSSFWKLLFLVHYCCTGSSSTGVVVRLLEDSSVWAGKKTSHYLFCYGLLQPAEHKGVFLPGALRAAVSPVPSDTKAFSNVKSWSEPVGISERRKLWDLIDGGRWGLSGFTFMSPLAFPFSFCGMHLPYNFHCVMKLARQRSMSWGLQIVSRLQLTKESRTVCRCLSMCLGWVCPNEQICHGEQRNGKSRSPIRTEFVVSVRLFFWWVPLRGQLGCFASLLWRETSCSTHIGPRKEIQCCRKSERVWK